MDKISFILNDCEFKFPCTRKILNKIPDTKEDLYSQLFSKHTYIVNSKVRNETFQSFLDNWQNDTTPQISSDNILEYYQLSQEFGIFNESLSTPQQEPLLCVNLLKANHTLPFDKSSIERGISLHLDTYIKDHENGLSQIQIHSLYNIFYHSERVLNDEDKAYQFIIKSASNHNSQLYILLGSLDAKNFKNTENQKESFLKKKEHFGLCPQNTDEIYLEMTNSLFERNDRLQKIIKLLSGDVKIYDDKEFENFQILNSIRRFDADEEELIYTSPDVYKVKCDDEIYALKKLYLDEMSMDDFHKLFNNISTFKMNPHINILQNYGIFFGNENYPAGVIQDLCKFNLRDEIIKKK